MSYRTFIRTWWKVNPNWPGGLEPHAGRKTWRGHYKTEEEAQKACEQYNSTHNPGKLSRKMEYTKD